ncbi:MAG: hypothetical protein U9O20_03625 [Patescibacteria group bacterium]|nr:hypothetical protein [Patescibacteria group bacterium]
MPKFEIHSKLGGRFYFAFKVADKLIFSSRDFDSKEKCNNAINLIKETPFEQLYDINVSSGDDYLFCIRDKKNRPIGSSKKPVTFSELTKKINLVKNTTATAEIVNVGVVIKNDIFVH